MAERALHQPSEIFKAQRLMVCGSRSWEDVDTIYVALSRLLDRLGPFDLMHGGATGADEIAASWARDYGIARFEFVPDYERHGKRAPHVRNDAMLARATYVLAFWDGKSRGTKSVIDKAVKRDLNYEVHAPEGVEIDA